MLNFLQKSTNLRIEVINYITDYLKKANRNIVVPHGALSYLCWDCSQESNEKDYVSLVPEIEITMIALNEKGELYFIDATGEEVHQGNLDTEELIYVADFIDELIYVSDLIDKDGIRAPGSEETE
jgi:hypothetical protein